MSEDLINKKDSESDRESSKYMDDHKKNIKRENRLWIALMLSIFFVIDLYIYIEYRDKFLNSSVRPNQTLEQAQCEDSPPQDKSYYILDNSLLGHSDVVNSKLKITNQFGYHVVVQISSVDNDIHYAMVSVLPNSQTSISLPVGSYGLELKAGTLWCNTQIGFSDGETINVSDQLDVEPDITQEITIEAKGPSIRDIHLSLGKTSPTIQQYVARNQVDGYGITELTQTNNGYFINGTINQHPTTFQVDTGAGITSIPIELAKIVGVTNCNNHSFETANGSVVGCVGIVPELTFGNFRVENVEIAVMPNMKNSLLGMNILSNIRVESSNGLMRLTMN